MSYYWTTKMNEATNRRLDKLENEGVQIDTTTHAGRSKIGYNYLELALDESDDE
jgi:biotin operon repressor